ncbi:MAG TPA: hypothetical protein VNR41_03960 [Xanthobacteraceae bacterium]|nr:hypothetical protein [Xanthobacteraceae bacterium]
MPRVNPYRSEYDYASETPTTSSVMLFLGLLAAIVLAAFVWAAVSPPDTQPNAAGTPNISEPATPTTPAMPRTPSPAPAE